MRAFLADGSPDAYEKVVDRLLASPRYAEQRAMHWLDAVRYADTAGFHGDNPIPAWPYRDYVLQRVSRRTSRSTSSRASRSPATCCRTRRVEQRVASAYNRLNRTSAEGGLQPKEYLAKYGADRVRTVSAVWLGSTLGCAECHDHKFDPFLSKDFYAMKAFFADIKETGLVPDRGARAWGATARAADRGSSGSSSTALETRARRGTVASRRSDRDARSSTNRREKPICTTRWQAGELAWTWQHPIAARALERRDAHHLQQGAGGEQLLSRRQFEHRHQARRRPGRRRAARIRIARPTSSR